MSPDPMRYRSPEELLRRPLLRAVERGDYGLARAILDRMQWGRSIRWAGLYWFQLSLASQWRRLGRGDEHSDAMCRASRYRELSRTESGPLP